MLVLVQPVLFLVPAVLLLGLSQQSPLLCFGKLRGQELCSVFPYCSVSYHQATFQGSTVMQCTASLAQCRCWAHALLLSGCPAAEVLLQYRGREPHYLVVLISLCFLAPS